MFKTLQSKLIFLFSAVLFIIMIILIWSFDLIIVQQFKLQVANELKNEINMIEFGLIDVEQKKFDTHLKSLEDLATNLSYRIILYDLNNKKKHEFNSTPNIFQNNYKVLFHRTSGNYIFEVRQYSNSDQKFLSVYKKVLLRLNESFSLGGIEIESTLEEIDTFSADVRFKIILAGVIILVLGILTIKHFTLKVTLPIHEIIDTLKEYSKTGIPQTLEVAGTEELKFLTQSINSLMKKIESDLNELRKLEKYRSEFLGNVSHELRTPIFTIQSYLETLIDGGVNDPEINIDYLKKAYDNLERLNQLLNDLIDISQIESRQLRLSFRYFNINDLIEKVIEDLKFLSKQKNILIEFAKDENLKELVFGDKERLYQVIYNLIDNAIRHNPSGTTVKVYYRKINSHLRIFIEDDGIGIPEEDVPRIFERFYRVNKERSRESGGTGLGLSIVKHILEAHESKILVESKLNEGSKFYFDLKIA